MGTSVSRAGATSDESRPYTSGNGPATLRAFRDDRIREQTLRRYP